jgi:hypothetical protein
MQIQRYAFAFVLATAAASAASTAASRSEPAHASAKASLPAPTAACDPGGICLAATVGTDLADGACGVNSAIDASVGDQLNFCYTVTNGTDQTLGYQSLVNTVDGTLLDLASHPLAPGDSYQFNHIATMAESHVYDATWTARDALPGYTFQVESAADDCIFADGFDDVLSPCGGGSSSHFVDITATGAPLGLDDEHSVDVDIPFAFDFYGTTSNVVTVSDNGGVLFNAPGSLLDWDNGPLPSIGLTVPAILPLWDDFIGGTGEIYVDTRGAAPNRQFIVEWFDRVHYQGDFNTDGATFELILNEDGTIQFEYEDVSYTGKGSASDTDQDDCTGGICATIGMQRDGSLFDQFSALEAAVSDHSGIKWTPRAVEAYTSTDSVTVNVGAPQIVVNPSPMSGTVAADGTATVPFAIENHGNRDLLWTIDEAQPESIDSALSQARYVVPAPHAVERMQTMTTEFRRTPHKHAKMHPMSPFAAEVPAYIIDHGASGDQFGSIDAASPSTFDAIGPASALYKTATFVANDFSKAYVASIDTLEIGTIDTATGAVTVLPASAPPTEANEVWIGLKWDATTGTLFGAACDGDGLGCHLYTVDPATGAPTEGPAITGIDSGAGMFLIDIAINAEGEMYAIDFISGALASIDKTTGEGTVIGTTGVVPAYVQSLEFDPSSGILYWASFDENFVGAMYAVDTNTGAVTSVGSLADGDEQYAFAIAVHSSPCSEPADLPWLSLDPANGTTIGGSQTPVAAIVDAAGHAEGETLAGTICVHSNDPIRHTARAPISVTVTAAGGNVPPTLGKSFNPSTVDAGTPSTLTITLGNAGNTAVATLTASLTDVFPAGLVVATPPNAATNCGGALTADAGTDSVTLDASGASIPTGGACTIVVDVVADVAGTYDNTIPAGALATDLGSNTLVASASLDVTDPGSALAPTLAKAFAPSTIAPGETSVLTITLGNDNGNDMALVAPLTDAFPLGLVVAAVPNASTDCVGGVLTADAGADAVTLDVGAAIPAGGSCSITVDVTPTPPGSADYANSIPAGALQTDAGDSLASADATLTVTAPPAPLPPTVAVSLSPTSVATDAPSTLTITLGNDNAADAALTAPLVNTLPSGLVVAAAPNATTTCGGNLTANAGDGSITLDAATIPQSDFCTITVDVSASNAGAYVDAIDAGALVTDAGSNAAAASDNVVVTGTFPAPYCTFVAGSSVEPVTLVDFAGISNASSETVVAGGSPEQSEDDLAISGGAVAPGSAYSLSVQGNTDGDFEDFVRVYFDWNHDGVFATDGSESADIGSITNSTGIDGTSASNVVPVPATAKAGLTRMRVVKTWAFYGAACGDNDFGQTEDYLVLVDPSAPQPSVPPVVSSSAAPDYVATPDGISTLTITLTNYNAAALALSAAMNDALPAGIVVANPSNAATTCPGASVQANPGDSTFSLAAAAIIPAGGSCTVQIDVTATAPGIYVPTLPIDAVSTANGGNPQPAVATIQFGDPNGVPTYSTGFESPDFTAADLDGQQGWLAQANVTAPSVTTITPATGTQHAQLNSTASTSTTDYPLAVSPAQLAGTSPYSTLSANLRISRISNGSTWEFDPQDSTTQLFATRVRFDKGAARKILVADFAQGTFADTGATWPIDTYFKLDIVVERATGMLDLCMDGTPIFHGDAGVDVASGNITQASVSQVLQSGSTAANTIFVDDIAIDNPGTSPCGVAPKPSAPSAALHPVRNALSQVRQPGR